MLSISKRRLKGNAPLKILSRRSYSFLNAASSVGIL
jgi:hypothetical protein